MRQWHVWFLTGISTAVFACFSTAVICYLSLIVPVSPWIDPTLALMSLAIILLSGRWFPVEILSDSFLIATAAGSVGGMVGTALAWSMPTLYFLDTTLFTAWLAQPFSCIFLLCILVLAMGGIGLITARLFMTFGFDAAYRFPIAQVVNQTIAVRTAVHQAWLLGIGSLSALGFHLMQFSMSALPRTIVLLHETLLVWWRIPKVTLHIDFIPMLWAIGSVTGEVIALPFLVAVVLKIGFLEPVYRVAFATQHLAESDFFLAFCTGLVLEGVVMGFVKLIGSVIRKDRNKKGMARRVITLAIQFQDYVPACSITEVVMLGCLSLVLLYGLARLSLIGSLYVLIAVVVCCYQLILFMGKIGLAPLGRFATFVMMPGLFLFKYSAWQATLVAACVEIAGGVAASMSSGMRALHLGGVRNERLVRAMQWLALLVSALTGAVLFWFLARYIGIGSAELVASRSQARALMLRADTMHIGSMLFGGLVAWLLQRFGINATLVLGGLVMPLDWSLILIASGIATRWLKRRGDVTAVWSGMLATSSLWMILRALFSLKMRS